jgi:hypothetical protein
LLAGIETDFRFMTQWNHQSPITWSKSIRLKKPTNPQTTRSSFDGNAIGENRATTSFKEFVVYFRTTWIQNSQDRPFDLVLQRLLHTYHKNHKTKKKMKTEYLILPYSLVTRHKSLAQTHTSITKTTSVNSVAVISSGIVQR